MFGINAVLHLFMFQFLCLKNIRVFLQTCKTVFQMKDSDLFDPYDLFDVKDFGKVSNFLYILLSLMISCSLLI